MTTQTSQPYPVRAQPSADAPNVLLVLTDDVGYGACSTFGGPVPTPVLDRLAAAGVRYTAFHTTAMCSPTRAALLTGRNHHAVGMGAIVESSRGQPGYNSVIPDSAATIAQVLSDQGYHTSFFGKHHNTPTWEAGPLGPFDRWPNGLGFDYFYGFVGAATSQFHPVLYENRNQVALPDNDPDYILDRDLADHAIGWLRQQHTLSPTTPFFMYIAPGAAHSPHQAPPAWIERFKGCFDEGWDAVREATFQRQHAAGVVPENARLTPRPDVIPAWDSLSPEVQRLAARMMEVYAAMLAHWDHQFGRIVDQLAANGQLDNTIVLFVQGDNGASGEGGIHGTNNDIANMNRLAPSVQTMLAQIDELGGPRSYANYPAGWAWAMNTPFRWHKQVASHFGGTRNGLVASWPRGMRDRGAVRHDFAHVVDIAPTLYAWMGITPPAQRKGVEQQPLHGQPLAHGDTPERRPRDQYFELMGHRAYYRDGWMASTTPRFMPWETPPTGLSEEGVTWELYHIDGDYAQFEDVSGKYPEKLQELQRAFTQAADRFHVYPLSFDYRAAMREPRPTLLGDRRVIVYHPTTLRLPNVAFPDIKNRSWRATARLNTTHGAAQGALISQGGWPGGWGLFLFGGRPTFLYKASNDPADLLRVEARTALAAGEHEVAVTLTHSGPVGGAFSVVLTVDGQPVAEGQAPRSIANLITGQEGACIGRDVGTPITEDYASPCIFDGLLEHVRIELL